MAFVEIILYVIPVQKFLSWFFLPVDNVGFNIKQKSRTATAALDFFLLNVYY